MRNFSDRSSFIVPALAGFLAAVLLAAVLLAVPRVKAYHDAIVRGETAYGWLASPVAEGATETRAAAFERLLAKEASQ